MKYAHQMYPSSPIVKTIICNAKKKAAKGHDGVWLGASGSGDFES